jgi:predicted polyphosphate/ATP-dependent NAD kinase
LQIGFIINPIAGMGGKVGLKGTDHVVERAERLGATKIAQKRALDAMIRFAELFQKNNDINNMDHLKVSWNTCSGSMGFDVLVQTGIDKLINNDVKIIFQPEEPNNTTAEDTKSACNILLSKGMNLIVFCGGDGTARDIYSVVTDNISLLGIPSGVKMHSGVFATHARVVGDLLIEFINGNLDNADGEILDLDEDMYRAGEWNIKLFGVAKTPHEPSLIQCGKHIVESATEEQIKEEIAEYVKEKMIEKPEQMYILGSGSTVQTIAKHLGISGSLLGIDAVLNGELIGKDLNEQQLLDLISIHPKPRLILSPIGAQGFILGRGNLQLSPKVINKIGIENIDVVSTPAKLNKIHTLRVDTNDPDLDERFEKKGWMSVIFGYRQMKLKKISN